MVPTEEVFVRKEQCVFILMHSFANKPNKSPQSLSLALSAAFSKAQNLILAL